MKRIAYQGVEGAFSHITALREFGEDNSFIGCATFKEVFDQVICNKADLALIPLENSLIGSIYENYDLLAQHELKILQEHYTRIEHTLLVSPCYDGQEIKKVLSHPKAIEQCRRFLTSRPWIEAIVHIDTAAAAKEVADRNDPTLAAIAHRRAGEIYNLRCLQENIEDDSENYTRFVVVSSHDDESQPVDKCSLIILLNHVPGALSMLLGQLADEKINLTKIESRPIHGRPFEYRFTIDLEFPPASKADIEEKLKDIKQKTLLGFYKRGQLWKS